MFKDKGKLNFQNPTKNLLWVPLKSVLNNFRKSKVLNCSFPYGPMFREKIA